MVQPSPENESLTIDPEYLASHPERLVLVGDEPISDVEIKEYGESYANGLRAAAYLLGAEAAEAASESAYYREYTGYLNRRVSELETENAELDREASLNPVSQIYNERGLQRKFEAEIAANPNARYAVIAIDLGSFKAVNDELGHDRGNELLRQVGNLFRRMTDLEAIVANPHGDEFVIAIDLAREDNDDPELSDEDRIKAHIERIKGLGVVLTLEDEQLADLGFSISAGGVVHEPGVPLKHSLNKADSEMYRDKIESLPPLTTAQEALLVKRQEIDRQLAEEGLHPRLTSKYLAARS